MKHRHGPWITALACVALMVGGCDDDDDGGTSSTSTSGGDDSPGTSTTRAWLVGEQGEMLAIDAAGVSGYDLDSDADLLAIACHGLRNAWAVGAGGTFIITDDAGATWDQVYLSTESTLRGVTVAGVRTDVPHTLFVVGDQGAVHASFDGGARWGEIGAPRIDFSSVSATMDGQVAVLSALDGSIWRYEVGDTIVEVAHERDGDVLHGIGISADGNRAVAVGDLGLWLESDDVGQTWRQHDPLTTRDLHAVQVAMDGSDAIAVGEAGTVLHWDDAGPAVSEHLDPALSLNGLHIASTGSGIAVGDAGVVLISNDGGHTWSPTGADTHRDLFGVDELGIHPHL